MAYSQDFRKSAIRHLKAAQVLHGWAGPGDQPGCRAVAGYLFGLAGELAVKEIMRKCGIKPEANRRDDPFFAHFPKLKSMLATNCGRRAVELRNISEDPGLFQNWDTDMRYAPTKNIDVRWVDAWKASAERLIDRMGAV